MKKLEQASKNPNRVLLMTRTYCEETKKYGPWKETKLQDLNASRTVEIKLKNEGLVEFMAGFLPSEMNVELLSSMENIKYMQYSVRGGAFDEPRVHRLFSTDPNTGYSYHG